MATEPSLFPDLNAVSVAVKTKRAKLGRYERLKRDLQADHDDEFKIFVDVRQSNTTVAEYKFIDLFCGAGGITKGLSMAGFTPVASVEISEIASATHIRNFPNCKHYCGDIRDF